MNLFIKVAEAGFKNHHHHISPSYPSEQIADTEYGFVRSPSPTSRGGIRGAKFLYLPSLLGRGTASLLQARGGGVSFFIEGAA